jgi:hypothetical protein
MTERLTYMTKRSEFTLLQQIGNSRFDFRLSPICQDSCPVGCFVILMPFTPFPGVPPGRA